VSGVSSATGIERELRAICGEENVSEEGTFAHHFLPDPGHPIVVAKPGSAEEVAAILQLANAEGLSIIPEGGNTNRCILQPADILLRTSRLTQVEHYDHADLTVGVGAGMTVARLNNMVSADRLLFALDPPFPERATVGGVLATASHGPLRHGYGALRDFCIGIRFVTGDGRRAKGGGRVVKNVAGYDLMKLLIGSYGTLAVITSASFKLFPASRQTRTYLAEFSTAAEALKFRDLMLRLPLSPVCLELVSPGARKLMRPEMASDAWVICVRAAGSDAVLTRYRKELGAAVTRELEGDGESKMWRAIEKFPFASDAESEDGTLADDGQRIQITVPPRDVMSVVDALNDIDKRGNIGVAFIGRVGVGHVLAVVGNNDSNPEEAAGVVVDVLRKKFGADINVKIDSAANPWPIAPADLACMRAVKQALDPKNVLRGRTIF